MLAAGALLLTGCGATAKQGGAGGADSSQPISGVRFMVPNTAGSGYDTTARAAAKVMDDIKVTKNVEVFNLAGAGGTVGLSRTVSEKGNGKLLMMMGLGVVGAQYTNKSEAKLDQTTPIAKLIEESGAIVVPKNSPYKTIDDLVAAWKADPKSHRRRRRLLTGRTRPPAAHAAGADRRHRPQARSTSSPTTAAVTCCRRCSAARSPSAPPGSASSSTRSRPARCGCWPISGAERVDAIDAPTLNESGIDLVFTNWRGVVAPPEISDDRQGALVDGR